VNVNLDKIVINGGTQSRDKIDESVVADYADAMLAGAEFPPLEVFHDGVSYWLADGFHRYFAAKRAKSPGFKCNLHEGTLRDAILFSFGANKSHGLQRSAATKRKIVTAMLSDLEWQDWSDRDIAVKCGFSHTFVSAVRKELGKAKSTTTFNRMGKVVTRKDPEKKQIDPVPEFSEAEVEREEIKAVVDYLKKQNEELQDQLTVVQAASIDDIQKEKAQSIIKDLRAQIRALEIELKEITVSRDMYQRENGELKKQVASLLKKLKKLEG
jgi:DNA-binding transcriptional regulator YhcF (GntR family)